MIRNKKQYEITKKRRSDFLNHHKELGQRGPEQYVHPKIHAATLNGILSMIATFDRDLEVWEHRSRVGKWLLAQRYSIECFWVRLWFRLHGIRAVIEIENK